MKNVPEFQSQRVEDLNLLGLDPLGLDLGLPPVTKWLSLCSCEQRKLWEEFQFSRQMNSVWFPY